MTSSQAPTDGQTQTDAVNRTAQEILAALQAKDSAKVASFYAPNAVLATPGRPAAKDSPRTPGHRRPSAQVSGALPSGGTRTDAATSRSSQPPRGSTHANRCGGGSSSASSASICRGLLLRGTHRVRRWQRRWRKKDFRRGHRRNCRDRRFAIRASGLAGVVTATTRNPGATSNRRQASAYAFSVRRLL